MSPLLLLYSASSFTFNKKNPGLSLPLPRFYLSATRYFRLLIICAVRVQGVDHYLRADKYMYIKY